MPYYIICSSGDRKNVLIAFMPPAQSVVTKADYIYFSFAASKSRDIVQVTHGEAETLMAGFAVGLSARLPDAPFVDLVAVKKWIDEKP